MADVKKCDLCGFVESIMKNYYVLVHSPIGDYYYNDKIDICGKCLKKVCRIVQEKTGNGTFDKKLVLKSEKPLEKD